MSKPLPIPRGSVTSTPPQTVEGGSEARLALLWGEVEGSWVLSSVGSGAQNGPLQESYPEGAQCRQSGRVLTHSLTSKATGAQGPHAHSCCDSSVHLV